MVVAPKSFLAKDLSLTSNSRHETKLGYKLLQSSLKNGKESLLILNRNPEPLLLSAGAPVASISEVESESQDLINAVVEEDLRETTLDRHCQKILNLSS